MQTAFASVLDFVDSLVLLSRSMGSETEEGLAAGGDKYVMGVWVVISCCFAG